MFLLVAGITFLHYSTDQGRYYFDIFYGELYYLPIALAAFWFGLRGALLASGTITVCYLPYIFLHWQDSSTGIADMDRLLSLLLYNSLAVFSGILKDRDTASREKSLQAENLAVMGRSIAAVAHDMKTPLTVIGGLSRLILKKMDHTDPARAKMALIIKETDKMESMAKDMLDFSKPLTLNMIQGNFDTIVRDCLAKLEEATLRHNVTIEYKSHPDVDNISVDTLRLEQVIINLVLNAIESSSKGGTVAVTLSPSAEGLIFDVSDNGCGIPFAERQKVFDLFFTTKKEGTGLGLPIVKKIVEAHGWSLQILDNDYGGTTFRIKLTATQQP